MEHMKLCHKQEAPQPTTISSKNHSNLASIEAFMEKSQILAPPVGPLSPNDQFNLKRRIASHVCQTCGKSYVNEGSLRKHLSVSFLCFFFLDKKLMIVLTVFSVIPKIRNWLQIYAFGHVRFAKQFSHTKLVF